MDIFVLRRAGCGAVFLANALHFNRAEINIHWVYPQSECIVLGFKELGGWLSIRSLSDLRMPVSDLNTLWLDYRADIQWDCLNYLTWDRFESSYIQLLLDLKLSVDYDSPSLEGYWRDYMTTMGMTNQ